MKFITIRDFRAHSAQIQQDLPVHREMVLTSNGKPIAIMAAVSEETFDVTLIAIQRARAMAAVAALQAKSSAAGTDTLSDEEIQQEIAAVRNQRRR